VPDRSILLKFLQISYGELFPEQHDFSHLTRTVERHFSKHTPLWWVEPTDTTTSKHSPLLPFSSLLSEPIACLWMGNAIDQVTGNRHTHIFLLYVMPAHRHQGIGSALMRQAENWARARGDCQIGLQVFENNQPALRLYQHLGYQTQSLWMVKGLE
jgi:ribosomal protein S18 acetylase RimI-like enzyme